MNASSVKLHNQSIGVVISFRLAWDARTVFDSWTRAFDEGDAQDDSMLHKSIPPGTYVEVEVDQKGGVTEYMPSGRGVHFDPNAGVAHYLVTGPLDDLEYIGPSAVFPFAASEESSQSASS